jgi:hypothetical protein
MKLLLTTILVLTIAVVPAFAQDKSPQDKSPTAGAGPSSGAAGSDSTTLPKADKADTATPSASPGMAATPASKDDCAKGGWAQFKDQKFKGEAECVAFVEKQGKSK